jgi:hypothetical protein
MGPPGTALRPPTGLRGLPGTQLRQPTAAGRPASRQGLGPLNTNVQVADRPVTQQGMMGMKVTNQGPGRQVADKSYYMGELRKKCDDLGTEIQKMNNEIEQHNKDNTTYTQMERKYESLIKEVRKLQGDLADYNLIVDKSRTKTDPQDIAAAYQQLKARNDMERRRVDDIFTERQHKESEIVSLRPCENSPLLSPGLIDCTCTYVFARMPVAIHATGNVCCIRTLCTYQEISPHLMCGPFLHVRLHNMLALQAAFQCVRLHQPPQCV